MRYGYGYYMDPTYFLVLAGAILCMAASFKVKSTYKKYARVQSLSGLTGAEAAAKILSYSGIRDVSIERVGGELTDQQSGASVRFNLRFNVSCRNRGRGP